MQAYEGFAYGYDYLMKDVDYDRWAENVVHLFDRFNKKPKTLVELACGTGSITTRLYRKGYDITGTDLSEDMLMVAQDKAYGQNLMIPFVVQDMREITIRKQVDGVVSICDGFNYLLTEEDLDRAFKSITSILKPEGILVFDISSAYKLEHILGGNTFAEVHDQASYIWENYYDGERRVLEFDLNVFIRDDEFEEMMYERFEEHHTQKAHQVDEILRVMEKYFSDIVVLDADTLETYTDTSERIYFAGSRR